MQAYSSLFEAVNDLQKKGYTYNFNIKGKVLACNDHQLKLQPDEFTIDTFYRFEGDTDPGDETIVYAISSPVHKVKGLLVNAFGVYNDTISAEIISKLSAEKNF